MKVRYTDKETRRYEAMAKKNASDVQPIVDNDERYDGINRLIRRRYSLSRELSITRHALNALMNNRTIPDEFVEFSEYCEQCKREYEDRGANK